MAFIKALSELLKTFSGWFCANWPSNLFTLFTVGLSGVISLVISWYFEYKGNQTNAKMSIIHPIISLLKGAYTWDNYKELCNISKEYSVRYLKKKDKKKLDALLLAYGDVCTYDDVWVKAQILVSYFEYKLKENGIDAECVPSEIEGEITWDRPVESWCFLHDLKKALLKDPDVCEDEIISYYKSYCREQYTSEEIAYFDDYTLEEVLKNSKIRKEWDEKFNTAKKAKEEFLSLKIVKDIFENR